MIIRIIVFEQINLSKERGVFLKMGPLIIGSEERGVFLKMGPLIIGYMQIILWKYWVTLD